MQEILRKLVQFRTVTGDETATHQAVDYIASFVARRGMHVERFDSNGYESLVATIEPGQKKPKVLLAAHIDVVPAPDEAFELREESGKLYGRGVLDMKCAIAAYLQIIDELQDHLEAYDFGLMITSDEEDGGQNGVGPLVAEGYEPQVCILPDGGDSWQIQVFSKGCLRLKIKTEGRATHAARPWEGSNAIVPLMEILQKCQALFDEPQPDTNTYNIGIIEGGQTANQVPDSASGQIDIRLVSKSEKARIFAAIRQICEPYNASIDVICDVPTTEFRLDHSLIAPFAQIITEVTDVEVVGAHTLGSNDARFFAAKNIPCISFYPTGGDHHGPNEWLDAQAFVQMKEVIQKYLEKVARL